MNYTNELVKNSILNEHKDNGNYICTKKLNENQNRTYQNVLGAVIVLKKKFNSGKYILRKKNLQSIILVFILGD